MVKALSRFEGNLRVGGGGLAGIVGRGLERQCGKGLAAVVERFLATCFHGCCFNHLVEESVQHEFEELIIEVNNLFKKYFITSKFLFFK